MKKGFVAEVRASGSGEGNVSVAKYSLHSVQDNLENLAQLQREHRQRLQIVEEECSKLKKYRGDYVHLEKRLKTLPDKTSHEVMVPIGPLAFMPGRLIHTNEILVLLGDNWFAERSAKEAVEVINRRIKDCDEKIESAETTKNIHLTWLKETSDLFQDGKDQVEIVEELTEEEFEKSKEEHRKKVAEHYEKKRQMFSRGDESNTASDSTGSTSQAPQEFISKLDEADKRAYESIMRRLDQLELEEDEDTEGSQSTDDYDRDDIEYCEIDNEEGAQGSAVSKESNIDSENGDSGLSKQKKKLKRRVSWADDKRPLHTVIPDDDSESIYRIKYTTKQLSLPLMEPDGASPDSAEEGVEAESSAISIQSPSDLYREFGTRRSSLQDPPPRGILKKTYSNPESQSGAQSGWSYMTNPVDTASDSPDEVTSPSDMSATNDKESLEPAFTYKILERNPDTDKAKISQPSVPAEDNEPKRVSRFKAARMKK